MRVLVVHAHPVETSFSRALFRAATEALTTAGHSVDALDLYAEDFPAAMSREERLRYHDVPENRTPEVAPYVERLLAAEGLVFVYPVWNYGFPAILKGYFDRVFIPGVSFVLKDSEVAPNLRNIRKVAFVTTYGGDRVRSWLMGDPPRTIVRRMMWTTFRTPLPPRYLALYGMNRNGEKELRGFLDRVRQVLSRF